MSIVHTASTNAPVTEAATGAHPVRRATLVSGGLAAVGTTVVAAVAHEGGVPLAIDGEAIPIAAFAQMTLLGAVLGGLIVAALNRYVLDARSWFVCTAVVLTALSCIPSVTFPPDVATQVALVATHVIAAVVIVPALARHAVR